MLQAGEGVAAREALSVGAHLRYVPGLDGLRAIAVLAVLLYHAGLPVPGGFLGVESFFVISGFLITMLLLTEWRQHAQINLLGFWLRRARRLLPALLFLVLGTLLFALLWLPDQVADIAADAGAAFLSVLNWRLIWSGQSYFDPLLRPPLLQHVWSLAVEAQFYLVWPLLFVAGMRALRSRGMLVATLLGAAGSLALMGAMYRPGADPSRVYYGTDTRAAGLLFGATLAFIRLPGDRQPGGKRSIGLLLDGGAALSLCALVACFGALSARHPLLYPAGFALVDGLTIAVLVALTDSRSRIIWSLLGWKPLRAIGLRSYGIYLWHWPIFMVTRPVLDLPLDGLPLLALRLTLLAVVVEVSYRYVEAPLRHGLHAPRSLGDRAGAWAPGQVLSAGGPALRIALVALSTAFALVIGAGVAISYLTVAAEPALSSPSGAAGVVSIAPTASPRSVRVAPGSPTPAPAAPLSAAATTQVSDDTPVVLAEPQPTAPAATPTATMPRLDPELIATVQQILDTTVADGYVPGAVVSVSVPGYEPWSGASGQAARGRNLAMEPDTRVQLASITKMFTAVVVLQLVQTGTIELDAPIETYLPGLLRSGQRITVRQLLSHTTGIYDYQEDTRFFAEGYENPESRFTPAELVARADQEALAFRPGTPGAWKYSSTNYVILGMLVEEVTGRSLAEEMRERLFTPLKLDHTYFAPQDTVEGTFAQGYIGGSDQVEMSMSFVFATGNLVSTVDDLRRFADALFGGRLLAAESLTAMTTMMDTNGAFRMPELMYGLGVMGAQMNVGPGPDGRDRPQDMRAVLGHIGGVGGFRSAVWWASETRITIALSVNQADIDPNVLARDIFDAILTAQGR